MPSLVVDLFWFVLDSNYFLYNRSYYEQTNGVEMGALLSPMIVSFYMEYIEHQVLENAPLKTSVFYRYVLDLALWEG